MDHGKQAGITPRLIIHGGAGNIQRRGYPAEKYDEYRTALLTTVRNTHAYMTAEKRRQPRSALAMATHAVVQLEDCPLFNSARGAVFTRDGVNELEASVMVSRGRAKRGVGVGGLRRVRNPILLARAMLERGGRDLGARGRPSLAPA
ncbi:Isoaspartyl peptidase, partial [Tolypocladium capitatum]